ncbi:MAG: fibrillarin-like rRNA/tRNA 2'-O-methyltransferase [Candidatus Micrarchaeia archaeon]
MDKAIEIFKNVFRINQRLFTKNLALGSKVYGEDLVMLNGIEYRSWNPYRSKLAAAILNGLKTLSIAPDSSILYLGAATGTTCSHVSDIVGEGGTVYCVEISERSMRDLIKVCEKRPNMLPILSDARSVSAYSNEVGTVDSLYQDVSSRDQAEILLYNSVLLKNGGFAYVAIKSQSISTASNPEEVYKDFLKFVSSKFKVLEKIKLEPFDKKHLFVVLKKI